MDNYLTISFKRKSFFITYVGWHKSKLVGYFGKLFKE